MRYGQDDGGWGVVYVSRLEDVWLWGVGGVKSSDALPFRVFADAIFILRFRFHGLKSPRLLAFGFASFRRTFLSFCFLGHVLCVAFVFGSASFRRLVFVC